MKNRNIPYKDIAFYFPDAEKKVYRDYYGNLPMPIQNWRNTMSWFIIALKTNFGDIAG